MDNTNAAEKRPAEGGEDEAPEVNVNDVRERQRQLLEAFNMHLMKAGQTQANLARIARVSPQTIHQVATGRSNNREATNIIRAYLPAFWHDHMKDVPKDGG